VGAKLVIDVNGFDEFSVSQIGFAPTRYREVVLTWLHWGVLWN